VFPPPDTPVSLRAGRTENGISIDGRLDEDEWRRAAVATGFIQSEPRQGERAALDTEVRVLFDENSLYLAFVCHDPGIRTSLRVRDLRRDFDTTTDDVAGVSFDPFHDRQNAMTFLTNPAGAQRDQLVRDNGSADLQWDGVWSVRTTVSDTGWIAEMAIPWSTLRYPSGQDTWGVNFLRITHRLQETSGWSPWPRQYSPFRMMYAGVMTGVDAPPPSANVRIVPYSTVTGTSTRLDESTSRDGRARFGGDVKWAVTPTTVLDATVNTDFAQADVDRQVVNLTRFSVLFPERRQFFLENAGLFTAGISQHFWPFFTRRIGLDDDGVPIRMDGGARLTTRSQSQSAGLLFVRQGESSATDHSAFGVARYIKNLPRQSRVGAILVTRHDKLRANHAMTNSVGGVDWYVNFSPTVYVRGMLAASATTGGGGEGLAGSVDLSHEGNRVVTWWVQEFSGAEFKADAGFVQRPDAIRTKPGYLVDSRPRWRPASIRNFRWGFTGDVFHRASDGEFQEASWPISLSTVFTDGSSIRVSATPTWQRLDAPFRPLTNVVVTPGRYQYIRWNGNVTTDPSARFGGRADVVTGDFYDGRLHVMTLQGRASLGPKLSMIATYELDALREVGSDRRDVMTHLVAPEIRAAFNPRLQVSAFYQHNTAARASTLNARFSWEFLPLSYLYVVYNGRSPLPALTLPRLASVSTDRALIVKLVWLRQL
jgi:hypothetical protein